MIECMRTVARKPGFVHWIPVSERLPKSGEYILLSFENFSLPVVGRYEGNKDERSYFSTAVRSDVYLCFHTDVGGETDAHQFDVVADDLRRRAG